METVKFNGWDCIRLSNGTVEALVTRSVGPRIIRYGFVGGDNMFCEIPGEQNGSGEDHWMNRGGHRLWIAPEGPDWSYELDNGPYAEATAIPGGVHVRQEPGPATGVQKEMDITMESATGFVKIRHRLTNCGNGNVRLAPWTINVMGPEGRELIPLPPKAPHSPTTLLPNQNFSFWSYSDFADPRWTWGSRFVMLRQDPSSGTNQKLGIRNKAGWAAYERKGCLFIMKFQHAEGVEYPDFGCNYETFTNNNFTEMECLGPMVTLAPGDSTALDEEWRLYGGFEPCADEADALRRLPELV